MKTLKTIPLAFLALLFITGCQDSVMDDITQNALSADKHQGKGLNKVVVELCGSQEVPAVQTSGEGSFEYYLNSNGDLDYKLKAKHLSSNVLFAHIHIADCGQNGPVGATIFGNFAPNGIFGNGTLINGTLSDADLVGPLAGMTINDLMNIFSNGGAYINLHTVNNPSGELRGQIGDDTCECNHDEVKGVKSYVELCGSQEVPAVTSNGEGEFSYKMNNDGSLTYKLKVKNMNSNVVAAHIHLAGCGSNGPVGAFLYSSPTTAGIQGNGTIAVGSLSDSDLIGPLAGQTIADLMSLFNTGGVYINVHSVSVPSGELRGQVNDANCNCN